MPKALNGCRFLLQPRIMNLNRRSFLKATGLGIGGLGLQATMPSEAAAADKPDFLVRRPTVHIGMVTYNLGADWDIATIIKNCEAAKFE